jgi:PAS domain S-box-containing protein
LNSDDECKEYAFDKGHPVSIGGRENGVSGRWAWQPRKLRWLDLPIRSKGIVVISIPLVAILLSLIALEIFQHQRAELTQWIERAFLAGSRIQSVITLLVDAENGVRGFRLTQDVTYLEPYHRAATKLSLGLKSLRKTLSGSSSQLQRIDRVESLSREWLVKLEGASQPLEAFDFKDQLAQRRVLMEAMQREFAAMRREEGELWIRRIVAETSLRKRLSAAMYSSACFSLLAGGFSMVLFVIGIATRLQRLRENARRMVHREPLMSVPPGADEIGQLAEQVVVSGRLLSEQEAELRQINKVLDLRVQERTLQLERREQQLQEQKTLLQTTFDSIGEGIVVSDENGGLLLSNPAAERILGKGPQESGPDRLSEVNSVFLTDAVPLVLAARGEASDDVLLLVRCGNPAQEKWLSVSSRPLRYPDGSLRGGLAVFDDITERKRALEALARSEERLSLTLHSSGIGAWSWDNAPNIVEADENCSVLFGLPVGQFPQTVEGLAALVHPDDRNRVQQELAASVEDGAEYNTEFRVVPPEGAVRAVAARGKVYYGEAGRPYRLTGVCWDMTERRQAEENLRKSEEQYRLLFECNPQPMWVYDVATLAFLAVNEAAVAKYGYSRDEFLEMDIKQVSPPDYLHTLLDNLRQPGQAVRHTKNSRHVTKHCAVINVEIISHELVYGGISARLALINDVTEALRIEAYAHELAGENAELTKAVAVAQERKRVEEQIMNLNRRLEDAAAEAEAANRAKSTFLSTMSHEIRTPMNAILGYAQLMLRDPGLGTDAKANLKIIGRSGEHLLALINDVLDLSKIEAGRTELNPVTFNLSMLLKDLAAMFRLRAEAKALQFEMLVDGASILYVVADEGKIRQALINLLGNAIKFTKRGQVRLHVTLDQRSTNRLWLSARVEDTGPGLTDEEQSKLFEPFRQTKGSLNTQEGTGLGLAISRKYARLMGGDITVTSSPGRGSIFRLEIPIERGDAAVAVKAITPRRVIGIRTGMIVPKILVVDDQLENRDWLMQLLTSIGFSVRGADNGEAAIRNWEEWNPQLILMDMHMPVMDGLEATRRIKADPRGKETVIAVLTASAMDDDRRAVSQSGADGFLTKPCREDELFEKMRALLNIAYDYEEMSGAEGQPFIGVAALSAEKLGQLPRELIDKLLNATLNGNKKLLDQLILKVRETKDAEFAQALQELADKYEYDALTRWLEEACCL